MASCCSPSGTKPTGSWTGQSDSVLRRPLHWRQVRGRLVLPRYVGKLLSESAAPVVLAAILLLQLRHARDLPGFHQPCDAAVRRLWNVRVPHPAKERSTAPLVKTGASAPPRLAG